MIIGTATGDITSPRNTRDIIIAMNDEFEDVTGIGRRFVENLVGVTPELGSVVTFKFDSIRRVHMLVCHKLGPKGWHQAERHVRYGMDYINHLNDNPRRGFSIVEIGTGRVGRRDGADPAAIRKAMEESYLPAVLYKREERAAAVVDLWSRPLTPLVAWAPVTGQIALAA